MHRFKALKVYHRVSDKGKRKFFGNFREFSGGVVFRRPAASALAGSIAAISFIRYSTIGVRPLIPSTMTKISTVKHYSRCRLRLRRVKTEKLSTGLKTI